MSMLRPIPIFLAVLLSAVSAQETAPDPFFGEGRGSAGTLAPASHSDFGLYRQFTNKNGQQIEARVVSMTPDRRILGIELKDGREFKLNANELSLDDQQFLRGWLRDNPVKAGVDFVLDVEIEKQSKAVRNESQKSKAVEITYEVSIRNRTRHDLSGARFDYIVVTDNRISTGRFGKGNGGGNTKGKGGPFFNSLSGFGSNSKRFLRKSHELEEPLAFNRVHTFTTEAVQLGKTDGKSFLGSGEERILGIILRVVGPAGELLGEFRDGEDFIKEASWDEIKANAFDNPGRQIPRGGEPLP